ncbi:MAG: energy-coupling factor ABC transporter permease [Bifidobacteriaceae bacterium]|jgi:cobalt/nickel transport system permease protein|nr:energy-coupling factor ABC transporter permease [Bifidobacteriaceae bacterium]
MHVPDHFLNDPTSIVTAVAATACVAGAVTVAHRDGRSGAGRVSPLGVAATTALIFGLQMVNYPVASGTSGHVLGGALAAALLGPAWGVVSLTMVVVLQSLIFADGGLTALGTNIILMAVVGTLVGWWVQRGVGALATGNGTGPAERQRARAVARIAMSVGAGALVSVVAAAGVFTALFAIGGNARVGVGALAGQMIGVHALVGIGEALITAGVVAAVAGAVPGWCAADSRGAGGAWLDARQTRLRPAGILGGIAVVAAAVLSPWASGAPDGLEATARAVGFAGTARDHALAGLPLADYGEATGLSVQLVGLIGLVVCVAVGLAVGRVLAVGRPEHLAAARA